MKRNFFILLLLCASPLLARYSSSSDDDDEVTSFFSVEVYPASFTNTNLGTTSIPSDTKVFDLVVNSNGTKPWKIKIKLENGRSDGPVLKREATHGLAPEDTVTQQPTFPPVGLRIGVPSGTLGTGLTAPSGHLSFNAQGKAKIKATGTASSPTENYRIPILICAPINADNSKLQGIYRERATVTIQLYDRYSSSSS